jgi:hypothetical protein
MTQSSTPVPLVPAEVDLQDFTFMPLDVQRLRDSDLAAAEAPEAFRANVLLWCAAWHQVPAGSIPDNDQWLAKVCGYLSRGRIDPTWKKVRDGALHGWRKCSDGRLYHPVVCEKALEAWIEKLANSLSGAAGNAKRWGIDVDTSDIRQQLATAVDMLRALAPRSKTLTKKVVLTLLSVSGGDRGAIGGRMPKDRKGQGQGQGHINTPHTPQGGSGGGFEEFWNAYPKRVNETEARKAFEELNPDPELQSRMLAALQVQTQSEQWKRDNGRYIPLPANWIADRRWFDQLPMPGSPEGGGYDPNAWTKDRSSIEAKGVELGLGPWNRDAFDHGQGETFAAYTERVRRAANQ